MAVLTPRAIFYHMPKTAGSWIRLAMETAGISTTELPCRHCVDRIGGACCGHACPADTVMPADGISRLRFTFVRHPLEVYRSYWAYKMREQWTPKNAFDEAVSADNFPDFVGHVLRQHPGWISGWFRDYVGADSAPRVHFVGRQESVVDDLIQVLKRAGEQFDEAAIRALPPDNRAADTAEWRGRCRYTPELRDAVMEAEQEAINRFYAADPVPAL